MTKLTEPPSLNTVVTCGGDEPLSHVFSKHVEEVTTYADNLENVHRAVATVTLEYVDGSIQHSQTVLDPINNGDRVVTDSITLHPEIDPIFEKLTRNRFSVEVDDASQLCTIDVGGELISLLYGDGNV